MLKHNIGDSIVYLEVGVEVKLRHFESVFVATFSKLFPGARKCTGKKNNQKKEKEKENNQEKIGVIWVDTIGDAAELLSPNYDNAFLYLYLLQANALSYSKNYFQGVLT